MKTISKITLMAASLIFLIGCHRKNNANRTQQETEQIKLEVEKAAEPLMTGWAALDGSIALKSFSREMVSCYDTLLLDYDAYAESWEIYTNARSDIEITTFKNDYIILSDDLVIDSWVGKVEEVLKTGEKIIYNPMRYTNIFRKSDGEWKIIFAQSTGIPVKVTPEI
jgi:hypothetical protein